MSCNLSALQMPNLSQLSQEVSFTTEMADGGKTIHIRFLSPSDMWSFIRITVAAKSAAFEQKDKIHALVARAVRDHNGHDVDSTTSTSLATAVERDCEWFVQIHCSSHTIELIDFTQLLRV